MFVPDKAGQSIFDLVTLFLAFSLERDLFLILFNFAIATSDYHSVVENPSLIG